MKNFRLIISAVILVIVFLLINPYNVLHHFNAESKVTSILADSIFRSEILDEDAEITNVKYLGSHMYRVATKDNAFILEIKKDKSKRSLDVFEHKQSVKIIYE